MTIGIPNIIGSLILKMADRKLPELLHLFASGAQEHRDNQCQCGAASANIDPDIEKLLGENLRKLLTSLECDPVGIHCAVPIGAMTPPTMFAP